MLGGVCLEIFFHLADVDAADGAEHKVLFGDVADFHRAVVFAFRVLERHGNVIGTVDFFANDAGAKRITVETHHQVEHCGAVVCLNGFVVLVCTQDFFGEVIVTAFALFKRKARVIRKVFKVHVRLVGEWIVFPHVGVSLAINQLLENEIVFLEQIRDVLAVEIAQVDDADFTAEARHVIDDFFGLCFADGEFVIIDVELFGHVHEGLDCEGIVLCRNGETLLLLFFLAVAFENGLVMVVELVRAGDEFFAFGRERDASACAVENGDADFIFELADGCRERRLGYEQGFGGLVEGACFCNPDGVT